MSTESVVINASPFILLCKCGLIELLPKLFVEISIPEAVLEEVSRGDDLASDLAGQFKRTWLKPIFVTIENEVAIWNLGDGETELLSFIYGSNGNFLALVDDRAARRCAQTLGIRTLGTAGLIVLAKRRNLIPLVKPELEKLIASGLYISDDIERAILKRAGE